MDPDLILGVLRSEFTDLNDLGEATVVVVRLLTAALLGALLGYNREKHNKSAGLRTHILVSMGAAMFVMVPMLAGMEIADLSRVIQGVIAGIGFIGAGTILKLQGDRQVLGLTTAAGIWMTAAIGITCGLGRELTAIISTFLAWAVLGAMHQIFEAGDERDESN